MKEIFFSPQFAREIGSITGEIWVLGETRFRVALVRDFLDSQDVFKKNFQVKTLGDAVYQLAQRLSQADQALLGVRFRRVSERECLPLIFRLLIDQSSLFPELSQELLSANVKEGLFPTLISRLKRFLDSVRLFETTELILKGLIDEFGNTRSEKRKNEELLFLFDAYQEYQREERSFDSIGIVELLIESLAGAKRQGALIENPLPEAIILDEPTHFFPLEKRLWQTLAKFTKLFVSIDSLLSPAILQESKNEKGHTRTAGPIALLPPSLRYSSTVLDFLKDSGNLLRGIFPVPCFAPHRINLIQTMFDGKIHARSDSGQHNTFDGLHLWECEERRDEVNKVVDAIFLALNSGSYQPSDFHIIAFDLEAYYPLLVNEFARRNIPLSIPRGIKLLTSATTMLIQALFDWLEKPSTERAISYFGNPFVDGFYARQDNTKAFLSRHGKLLQEMEQGGCFSCRIENHDSTNSNGKTLRRFEDFFPHGSHFNPWLIQSYALRFHYSDNFYEIGLFSDFILTRLSLQLKRGQKDFALKDLKDWQALFCSLSILEEQQEFLRHIRELDDPAELAKEIRIYFRKHTRNLTKLQAELKDKEDSKSHFQTLLLTARTLRILMQILRKMSETLKLLVGAPPQKDLKRSLLGALKTLFFDSLGGIYLSDKIDLSAVVVTELLDSRATHGKSTILLGMTSRSFPAHDNEPRNLGTTIDGITNRIYEHPGTSTIFETYCLISSVFRNSRELILTFPRETEGGEVPPAALVRDLQALCLAMKQKAAGPENQAVHTESCNERQVTARPSLQELLNETKTPGLVNVENGHKKIASLPAVKLLQARSHDRFNAYDGNIGTKILAHLKDRKHPIFQENGITRYSISSLELLKDCPHRFFFSSILGLRDAGLSFTEEISRHVGNMVHQSLERFFLTWKKKEPRGQICADNFEVACQMMAEIAKSLFENSYFDWESHPETRQKKAQIISGLDEPGDTGKRGFLKAALCYQRDYIPGIPWQCEYKFGTEPLGESPLQLDNEDQHIQVRGQIDRLDVDELPELEPGNFYPSRVPSTMPISAIWDYKTSQTQPIKEVDSGKSLQLPLYAAAVEQNFPANGPPKRGGIISLRNPNRRDTEVLSLTKGVLIEHLALTGKGKKVSLDEKLVTQRILRAIETTFSLDKLVRNGVFHQVEDTKHCTICEYRDICARDEILLKKKLEDEAKSVDAVFADDNTPPENDRTPMGDQQGFCVVRKSVFQSATILGEDVSESGSLQSKSSSTPLSSEQKQASDISKDIALIAGAGSGKTAVLRTRVVELLLCGVSLESILAITFTEKAALEMKARIEMAISEALQQGECNGRELGALERQRLLEAKLQMPTAQISTIHALAMRITQMDCELSGLESYQRVISGEEQKDVLSEITLSFLLGINEKEPAQGVPRRVLDSLLEAGIPYNVLVKNLISLVSRPQILGELSESFGISQAVISCPEQFQSIDVGQRLLQALRDFQEHESKRIGCEILAFLEGWSEPAATWLDESLQKKLLDDLSREYYTELLQKVKVLKHSLKEASQNIQRWFTPFQDLQDFLEEQNSFAKRKSKYNPRNYSKELKDRLSKCPLEIFGGDLKSEEIALELAGKVCYLARLIQLRYQALKKEEGFVDFEDLIVLAHRMLCIPQENALQERQKTLRKRLRHQFRHILIDEFQDTDHLQWELLKELSSFGKVLGEGQGGGELKRLHPRKQQASILPQARSIFLVGDSQQAIYSFRGGDVQVFSQAINDLTAKVRSVFNEASQAPAQSRPLAQLLSLGNNYRSHPGIVQFINGFFGKLLAADFDAGGKARIETAVWPQPMHAIARSSDNGGNYLSPEEVCHLQPENIGFPVKILLHAKHDPIEGDEEEVALSQNAATTNLQESQGVAKFIYQVLQVVTQGDQDTDHPWPALGNYRNNPIIAVLTRTTAQLLRVAKALQVAGVPFSISHNKGFYELEEIIQLENFLKIIADPEDEIALVGILRSPMIGLSDQDLVVFYDELKGCWSALLSCNGAHTGEAYSSQVNSVILRLQHWKQLASILRTSQLIEQVIEDTHLAQAYEQVGAAETYRNIQRFIDQLRKAEDENRITGGTRGVLHWIEQQRQEGATLVPNANNTFHPVVLMTIHGAKGLEFPMVILPFLDGTRKKNQDFSCGRIFVENKGSPQKAPLALAIKVEDEEEDFKRRETLLNYTVEQGARAIANSEERRIFYVACTRARDYLVLSMKAQKDFAKKQEEISEISEEKRREILFRSDKPAIWVRNILEIDHGKDSTSWMLPSNDFGTLKIPVLKIS